MEKEPWFSGVGKGISVGKLFLTAIWVWSVSSLRRWWLSLPEDPCDKAIRQKQRSSATIVGKSQRSFLGFPVAPSKAATLWRLVTRDPGFQYWAMYWRTGISRAFAQNWLWEGWGHLHTTEKPPLILTHWSWNFPFLSISCMIVNENIDPLHIAYNSGINTWATWCKEPTQWERPWCWEGLRAGGEGGDREWDDWMASLTQWTWVWANSRR